jgi:uncharacterized membrane protein
MSSFWIFMFCMQIMIPVVLIILGAWFGKHPPKEINGLVGYRTTRSMKNQDTWQFAHHEFGKVSIKVGLILLVASVIVMLCLRNLDDDTMGFLAGMAMLGQCVVIVLSIIPTERALKRTFDENGNRR